LQWTHRWNFNINAWGLSNTDWFAFWGTYIGGITTVIAVWLTVRQIERHFKQTSKEQQRQNKSQKNELEKQRRLDVLPLILLQPIAISHHGSIIFSPGKTEDVQERYIPLDELQPSYNEFDISELTIRFSPRPSIQLGGMTDEEIARVKSKGWENEKQSDTTSYLTCLTLTHLYPYWLINIGK